MEKVLINGKEYVFIKNYKDDIMLRRSYNSITLKTYGFDFEDWYESGYWSSKYIPYSLLDGKNIVANVSVSIINCLVLGENKMYIQIGTVMTASAYRRQGLVRYLMEKVIVEWKNKCGMLYLFANDSVLSFYPKFGFMPMNEYQCSKIITSDNEFIAAEKLNMSLADIRDLVVEKINSSMSMSKLRVLNNPGLVMFYCTSFMSDNVYYIRERDIIVIAEIKGDTLYLQDVFSPSEFDLDNIIKALINKEIKKVVLGFTPNNTDSYSVTLLHEENKTLFVMKDKQNLFENNKLMFPVLSHA